MLIKKHIFLPSKALSSHLTTKGKCAKLVSVKHERRGKMLFVCPVCGEKLNKEERRLLCGKGHSFDLAKEGYANLLVRGGSHGDNKEMVLSRRRFLSKNYYLPMAKRLSETILSYVTDSAALLDCGSGEGYYTDIVEKALYARDGKSDLYGFDISKDAVKASAKLNKRLNLAVASAYRQPFADESFSLAYNVFSPLAIDEVRRVLKDGGIFVMVIPDEYHLYEMKAKVYDTPYKNTVEDTGIKGFALISDEPIRYTMNIDSSEDISSLFGMTPYAYRTRRENAERLLSLDRLSVSAHFRILTYRKEVK